LRLLGTAALSLVLSGCGLLAGDSCVFHCGQSTRASTPLVEFLYGDDRDPPKRDAEVTLRLPIRVGLAFLPPRSGNPQDGPPAAQREQVLRSIRENFAGLPYVADIVPVPSYYFDYGYGGSGQRSGMRQLQQLARLQRLDLVALISYDQRTDTHENRRAITYLTIVGGMIFDGTHNDTRTVIDLAVIEPEGKSLVLRAGGVSSGSGSTTAIEQSHALARQQRLGFDQATAQLIANFRSELADFENRVRAGTTDVKVVRQARDGGGGGGGGGAIDWLMLAALLGCLATSLVARLKNNYGRRRFDGVFRRGRQPRQQGVSPENSRGWHGRKSSASVRSSARD
jgi:rhombotail lipoprotein